MNKLGENKYLIAARNLILFSAITHIILLAIYSIVQFDITYLNYFDILDLDLFFPDIAEGTLSQILSAVAIVVVYLVMYFLASKKSK